MVRLKKAHRKGLPYNLVVIELTGGERRVPNRPHLYVLRTQKSPETVMRAISEGNGPKWIVGTAKVLRPDLVPNHKPTRKLNVADGRLKKLKSHLSQQGFAVNGDARTWRVYVLDLDAEKPTPIKNRGKIGKLVYVGQTSTTISHRLAQHRGEEMSKKGRYIGSPKVKGRDPKLNKRLTPSKVLFTLDDARRFETQVHERLKSYGYGVRGDRVKSARTSSR